MNIFRSLWGKSAGETEQDLGISRRRLYRLAYSWCHDSALADDLVQETLIKALRKGEQVRKGRCADSWLCSVMANCWRDQLRGRRDHDDAALDTLVDGDTPESVHEQDETTLRVRRAVGRLPMGQRQVLTLVDLEGFSYADVAQTLDIPVGTVMSRISRARVALRELLLTVDGADESRPARPQLRSVK